LTQLFRGFTANPVYSVKTGEAQLIDGGTIAQFTSDREGLATAAFTVTDKDGGRMVRVVGLYISAQDLP
jgi:hypothetical protein